MTLRTEENAVPAPVAVHFRHEEVVAVENGARREGRAGHFAVLAFRIRLFHQAITPAGAPAGTRSLGRAAGCSSSQRLRSTDHRSFRSRCRQTTSPGYESKARKVSGTISHEGGPAASIQARASSRLREWVIIPTAPGRQDVFPGAGSGEAGERIMAKSPWRKRALKSLKLSPPGISSCGLSRT